MRRLIAAFILILIVGGLIFASLYTTRYCCDKLIEKVDICEQNFKENKNIASSLNELEDYWEKCEPMLMIFANHDTLEDIGYSIARLKAGDSEDFMKESAELKERIYHLKISEKFSFKSII